MSKRNDVSYDSSLILLRSPKANNFVRFNLDLTELKSEKKNVTKGEPNNVVGLVHLVA